MNKIESQVNALKSIAKIVQDLNERVVKIEEKEKSLKNLPKEVKGLIDKLSKLETEINTINREIYYNREQIEEKIKVQEEIIMDMIKKFNDEFFNHKSEVLEELEKFIIKFFNHKSEVLEELEKLRTQQDILKISYTVNENKLLEKIKSLIKTELKNRIQGKESELLMQIWIDEFRKISNNFEKIKKLEPKEFNLKLTEILNTIDQFKKKIHTYE